MKERLLTKEIEYDLENPPVMDCDLSEEDNEEAFGEDTGVYDDE